MKKFLASLVSRLFDPMIVLTTLSVVAILRSGMPPEAILRLLFILFFVMVLPPFLLLVWAIRTRHVTNLDVSNRKERIRVLGCFALFLILDLLLVILLGNAYLVKLFLLFFLWFSGFFIVTLFWKISGHTSVNTLTFLLILEWFGWNLWPILLTIPLVGWARVQRKNHTVAQVVGGVLYSASFLGLMLLTGRL